MEETQNRGREDLFRGERKAEAAAQELLSRMKGFLGSERLSAFLKVTQLASSIGWVSSANWLCV